MVGFDPTQQAELDQFLIDFDGDENKARLGANAALGVSIAAARAGAVVRGQPLYAYLSGGRARRLPVPMMNVLNGGKHADNAIEFQEFMIVPHGAPSFSEALRYGAETFAALRAQLVKRGYSTGVGDEGGFAPNLCYGEEACEMILAAISEAGLRPGPDVAIALDPAASSFCSDGRYRVPSFSERDLDSAELGALYEGWIERFPIVSIEDGFAEDDWDAFKRQTAAIGDRVQIVGDDLYVTNPRFIRRGVLQKATNAVLIKLNQIGTVTETIQAIDICRDAGWSYVISHRSGETEDPFIADFAVAMGGGQIKTGSLARSERVAKYNRLLEIEQELGELAAFVSPFAGTATAMEGASS